MGGVAGASGGAALTTWTFAVDAVPRTVEARVALILPETIAAALPAIPLVEAAGLGPQSVLRRQVLAALHVATCGDGDAVRLSRPGTGPLRIIGTDVFASVAHRPGWVAAVVAGAPVGIDVESVDDAARARDVILDGVAGAVDLAAWHGLAGIWAAKEAALKALGRDLTDPPPWWRFGPCAIVVGGAATLTVDLRRHAGHVVAVVYAGG